MVHVFFHPDCDLPVAFREVVLRLQMACVIPAVAMNQDTQGLVWCALRASCRSASVWSDQSSVNVFLVSQQKVQDSSGDDTNKIPENK